jgi:hypothetical protein
MYRAPSGTLLPGQSAGFLMFRTRGNPTFRFRYHNCKLAAADLPRFVGQRHSRRIGPFTRRSGTSGSACGPQPFAVLVVVHRSHAAVTGAIMRDHLHRLEAYTVTLKPEPGRAQDCRGGKSHVRRCRRASIMSAMLSFAGPSEACRRSPRLVAPREKISSLGALEPRSAVQSTRQRPWGTPTWPLERRDSVWQARTLTRCRFRSKRATMSAVCREAVEGGFVFPGRLVG